MGISQSWPQLHHSAAPGLAVSGESSHVHCGVQETGTREVGRMQINQDLSNTPENSFLRDKCLQRKPWETPTTCSACSVAERTAFITATCRGRVPAEHPPNFSLLQPSSPCSPRCPPRGRRVAFAAQWSCPWGVLAGLQLPTLPARTQSCPNKSQNGKRQWPARMHLSLLFP